MPCHWTWCSQSLRSWPGRYQEVEDTLWLLWYTLKLEIFIGPRSDHSLPMSATHSGTHLIFVIFFTRAKFLQNKIHTEITRKLRQNTQKTANFLRYYGKIHSKLPIFRVKSVKIYTRQKKFIRTCLWRPWQISGMPAMTDSVMTWRGGVTRCLTQWHQWVLAPNVIENYHYVALSASCIELPLSGRIQNNWS